MGIWDWLLTDPTQGDGGFLARMLLDHKAGDATAQSAMIQSALPLAAPPPGSSVNAGLLGESPLVNLLRSGFAGMNAANGYSGFGSQFAAGVQGGADAMAQRRRQMIDQINAMKFEQALQAKTGAAEGASDNQSASGDDEAKTSPCPHCSGAIRQGVASPDLAAGETVPNLPRIQTAAEYAALASGTRFVDVLGRIGVKP